MLSFWKSTKEEESSDIETNDAGTPLENLNKGNDTNDENDNLVDDDKSPPPPPSSLVSPTPTPPVILSWVQAHSETCQRRHTITASAQDIFQELGPEHTTLEELPTQDQVLLYNNNNMDHVIDQILLEYDLSQTKKSTTNNHNVTPTKASKVSSAVSSIYGLTSTVVSTGFSVIKSPVKLVVDKLVGESDYGYYEEEQQQQQQQTSTTTTTRRTPTVPRTSNKKINATDSIVCVTLALQVLKYIMQTSIPKAAPTIVAHSEFSSWIRQSVTTAATTTGHQQQDDMVEFLKHVSEADMNILVSCLQQIIQEQHSDSLQFVQRHSSTDVWVIGKDPQHPVDVRIALYDLQQAQLVLQTNLEAWQVAYDTYTTQAKQQSQKQQSVALFALKQRRLLSERMEQTRTQLLNLEHQQHALETAVQNQTIVKVMQQTTATLQSIRRSSQESNNVDDVLEDYQDELDHLTQLQESIQQQTQAMDVTTAEEEEELLKQLQELTLDQTTTNEKTSVGVQPVGVVKPQSPKPTKVAAPPTKDTPKMKALAS